VDYFKNIILSIDKSIYRTTLVLYMFLVIKNIVFQAVIEVFSTLRKEPESSLIKPRTLFFGTAPEIFRLNTKFYKKYYFRY